MYQNLRCLHLDFEQFVQILPNPAKKILKINSPLLTVKKVEIYSVLGKKIGNFNRSFENLYIEDLSSGLYLIRIFFQEGIYTTKFVKE